MVYYRKYRPQTINELDNKEIREKLFSSLSSRDVAHAFLFTGPRGLGKTSAARIVAKAVNCERRNPASNFSLPTSNAEPCNKCDQCISITSGTNIDVLEIDGASNRGIDEVRDLREKIRLAPARSYKKVYIIDEVHMLTTEAFNALLKTLEEPPSHVIFVLCTTEPHKVPATISSRCFHIPFKKATMDELARSFERIVRKEKLIVDMEALEFIASLSDGSFRDGAKILEEVASINKKITRDLVEKKYQISNIKNQISKMIEFLSKKNTPEGLRLVSELVEEGVDIKYLMEQLLNAFHSLLLYKMGLESSDELSIFNYQFSIEEIKELIELLSRAYGELKYAVLPQLPLELAIVEWGLQQQARNHAEHNAEPRGNQIQRNSAYSSASFSDKTLQSKGKVTNNEQLWNELIAKVKSYNHSIAGVLRGCTLRSYDSKKLIIETGYKFHKERLEEKKIKEILEKVSKEITGGPISISVLLKDK